MSRRTSHSSSDASTPQPHRTPSAAYHQGEVQAHVPRSRARTTRSVLLCFKSARRVNQKLSVTQAGASDEEALLRYSL
jgi:hypothetical protein